MIKRQQGTTMADGTDQLIQAVGIHRQNARDYLTELAIDPRDVPSRRRLEQERSEIARLKQAIRAAGTAIDDDPIDSDTPSTSPGKPAPQPASGASATSVDPREVVRVLVDKFSLDEIEQLAFQIKIDFDQIAGNTKQSKARELVQYLERRSRLGELVNAIRTERPGLI
jgi:Effector-associated domain 7